MAQGFAATVTAWVEATKERKEAVRKGSAQAIIALMQTPRSQGGNLRLDTGFLRSSLVVTTSTALPAVQFKPDGVERFTYDAAATSLVIAGAAPSDPITAVYVSNYALPREFGSRGQPGDRWVALAAQRWQQVVNEQAAKAQASVESRQKG